MHSRLQWTCHDFISILIPMLLWATQEGLRITQYFQICCNRPRAQIQQCWYYILSSVI
ncbi:hypothetical protein BDV06DRAFT_25601 [Aspergillus oleicola]